MAITIESANKALTRNGLGHIELFKHAESGELAVTSTCEAEPMVLGFYDANFLPITRVRDLTITEVVAMGGRLATMISERARKDVAELVEKNTKAMAVEKGIPERMLRGETAADCATEDKEYPTIARELVENPAITIREKREQNEVFGKFGTDRRATNFVPVSVSPEPVVGGDCERRYSIMGRTDNVAHVDNRSKARVYPNQHIGRGLPRPVTADTDVTQRNREELQQFAKAQNEAFIAANLTTFDPFAPTFQILRSGDLRVSLNPKGCPLSQHTWKLRDLGMRFMRDKSPAWWVDNAERLALGYLPEDAGPVLTQARVKQHALTLETIRDIANRNGRFAYLIVDDFGKSEAKQSRDLRDAFRRINQGERVFIHSADLKRYDRELKEGKHGDPRGSLDL